MDLDKSYMNIAFELASCCGKSKDVPVGSIIVDDLGNVVGKACNRNLLDSSPLSHAELLAIADASKLKGVKLDACTMYVTLEPCIMCFGAILNARIKRLVIGCYNLRQGFSKYISNYRDHEIHKIEVKYGVLESECSFILSNFFRSIREKK